MGAPTRARWKRKKDKAAIVAFVVLFGVLVSAVVALLIWVFLTTGQSPFTGEFVQGFSKGTLKFTSQYFIILAVVAVVVAAVMIALKVWFGKITPPSSWVDVAAQHMSSAKEASSLSRKAVTKKAHELGMKRTVK